MVHPWVLQEILGGGGGGGSSSGGSSSGSSSSGGGSRGGERRDGGGGSKRVSNPSDSTPTTFNMNWSHSENGPTDPQPQPSVCTFMGAPKTAAAGMGIKKWPDSSVVPLHMALQLLRKEGYTFEIPEDYEPEDSSYSDSTKYPDTTPELAYLRDQQYEDIEVTKDNETVFLMTMTCDWLYIRCANDTACSIIEEKFASHFALARVPHEAKTISISDGLEVALRTGNGPSSNSESCNPGTLFELKKNGKVICKCLCSYSNGEMDNAGPTIELFETAAEWQRHGYGGQLMSVVEGHFEDVFASVAAHTNVKFNVCYVTNRHACEWFLSQGFDDWDGMGEELGKYLLSDA